jgi:hypothetical protein
VCACAARIAAASRLAQSLEEGGIGVEAKAREKGEWRDENCVLVPPGQRMNECLCECCVFVFIFIIYTCVCVCVRERESAQRVSCHPFAGKEIV